jgi:hypothetical protein
LRSFARLFATILSMEEIKFDFDDIKLVPADSSVIKSRKSVNIKVHGGNSFDYPSTLPLMSAPMDSLVSYGIDEFNPWVVDDLVESGIRPVLPRNSSFNRYRMGFVSYSLAQMQTLFLGEGAAVPQHHVCIDMANGHMADLVTTVRALKNKYPELVLMVGNIANPYTYKILSEAGADYVRCGIGNGSGCFGDGTLVHTSEGLKPIDGIFTGDLVLTHTGEYKPVIGGVSYFSDEELLVVNGVTCTKSHEFYVVNRAVQSLVTEENYKEHAFFIEANDLTGEHLILSWK